ncbi:uncharacterized protein UTRI_02438 [Ustilago trichophora]|uniref:Uncharacterized protein n=1 Tax=Ustilago trichophora TaxID=86804 RepID=A0A5C3E6L6_9BASI|nr:uncharacterized protein UTRI_02438 [Ustilago trichophora]
MSAVFDRCGPSPSHPVWLKDIIQKIRSALLAPDESKRHSILSAIETAVEEQANSLKTAAQADEANHPAAAGPSPTAQIKSQISLRINDAIQNMLQNELDTQHKEKLPALVDVLFVVMPLLGPTTIVMEWWDLVLRPLLKNASVQNITAHRARELVVRAMVAAPSTAYEDEPSPTPVWPAPRTAPIDTPTDSTSTSPRRARAVPYPMSAAAPLSSSSSSSLRQPQRSSSINAGSGSAPGSRSTSVASRQDTFRRFTQRILDLYLAEAAQESQQIRADDAGQRDQRRASGPEGAKPSSTGNGSVAGSVSGSVAAGMGSHAVARDLSHSGHLLRDPAALVWKGNLESILLVYSNEKPKEFFHHIAESFSEPTARVPLLFLLSTFLRLYPIHAYHITSTALPRMLILSLQLDTSTTCVSLGVTAFIMLIPHIPNWIANGGAGGLPTLLSIFARIVDWRRLGHGWESRVGDDPELDEMRREKDEEFTEIDRLGKRLNIKPSLHWNRLESTFDTTMSTPPNAEHLFTFLYGLFPCNIIRFLRSPIDYLRKASFDSPFEGPWENMMDEIAVQNRSGPSCAERQRQGSMEHDAPDDENASIFSSEARLGPFDMGRRRSAVALMHPSSPSGSAHRHYQRVPHSVNPDDILLTYASLRSGAPLMSTTAAAEAASINAPTALGFGITTHTQPMTAAAQRLDESAATPVIPQTTRMAGGMTASGTLPRLIDASFSRPPRFSCPYALAIWIPVLVTIDQQLAERRHTHFAHISSKASFGIEPSAYRPADATARDQREAVPGHPFQRCLDALASQAMGGDASIISFLQRENLLLRNELNFELYLKEQHLRHIGRLHREKVTDTALEAERQNLYHTVRTLRASNAAQHAELERCRAEAASTKARHVQWEADLNNKLKAYREERKAWTTEARQLKAQAEEDTANITSLTRQLEESGAKLFELQTKMEADEPKLAKLEQYEAKIAQLTTCLAYWDNDVLKYEQQRQEMEKLLNKWDEMAYLVEATEATLSEVEEKYAKLEADNERLKAELEVAFSNMKQLKEDKAQLVVEAEPQSKQALQEATQLERERDELRGQNESLSAQLLDLKAKLESLQLEEVNASEDKPKKEDVDEEADSDVPPLTELSQ